MKNFHILLLLLSQTVLAQEFSQKTISPKISEVTVFLKGAQVTRTGSVTIPKGKTILKIENLSPHIDDKSIRVKASGNFTLLSVNHQLNYVSDKSRNETIERLFSEISAMEDQIAKLETRLDVLDEKRKLMTAYRQSSSSRTKSTLEELKASMLFFDNELTQINAEEMDVQLKVESIEEKKTKLQNQIADQRQTRDLPSGEILIRVEAKAETKQNFEVSYLVQNAGWFPKYDLRVEDVTKPLELTYKADVFQNTGTDWDNVKLRLSNAEPNQSGEVPSLTTWNLNLARNTIRETYDKLQSRSGTISGRVTDETGEGLPGANVVIKGSTIGVTTDLNGNYQLTLPSNAQTLVYSSVGMSTQEVSIGSRSRIDVGMSADTKQLQEVVVTGYSGSTSRALYGSVAGVRIRGTSSIGSKSELKTVMIENQTTVEFEVAIPYTINSTGESISVSLQTHEIETDYQYYAVPKLDKDAFLIARITNWDQYNLLEGEANLYFEDAFVGRSILNAKELSDTLDISLGRDKNIVIGRTKIDDFSKRQFVGSNTVEKLGFEILVRNKKSTPIKLTLFDQIPVSVINSISVEPEKLSGGNLDETTGEIRWELNLKPSTQKKLELAYEVKYPKYEKVYLE